ncbi:MAG: rhodanese-like domain-containing protein [Rhodobacteraceae bacterium]|nr:rhodanese-like domain-containing protein [Paracoccaceae bacterium]
MIRPQMRLAAAVLLATTSSGMADSPEVGITGDLSSVTVMHNGAEVEITRNQDTTAALTGEFAKTSRACPPFCVQPFSPAEGVTTIGELELMALLENPAATVVDSRVEEWFRKGTIPGSIHIPYTEVTDRLGELGCEIDFEGWDCTDAVPVALFCNGNWCGQSPSAIRKMVAAGYPAERISYYRGGMHAWQMLGLTVAGGGS